MKYAPQGDFNGLDASPAPSSELLNPSQLAALSARIGATADRIIQQHLESQSKSNKPTKPTINTKPASEARRGRPAKRITNPFFGFIGPTTGYGRYPYFAQDIVEGIARLDWHDRPIGEGGSSKPLSVRSLMVILEELEEVTTEAVAGVIGTKARQAQRYVKAIELAIPYLLRSRPKCLIFEMDLPEDELANAAYLELIRQKWGPQEELPPPSAEDLAKLRQDLGEDAFDPARGINAAYLNQKDPDDHHLATAA